MCMSSATGLRLHSLHDPRAMEFDGLLDDAEIGRDLLVEPASRHRNQYFALAWRETRETLFKLRLIGPG